MAYSPESQYRRSDELTLARLGVSMARSMLTHGLLWTIVDAAGDWIDTRPLERWAGQGSA